MGWEIHPSICLWGVGVMPMCTTMVITPLTMIVYVCVYMIMCVYIYIYVVVCMHIYICICQKVRGKSRSKHNISRSTTLVAIPCYWISINPREPGVARVRSNAKCAREGQRGVKKSDGSEQCRTGALTISTKCSNLGNCGDYRVARGLLCMLRFCMHLVLLRNTDMPYPTMPDWKGRLQWLTPQFLNQHLLPSIARYRLCIHNSILSAYTLW